MFGFFVAAAMDARAEPSAGSMAPAAAYFMTVRRLGWFLLMSPPPRVDGNRSGPIPMIRREGSGRCVITL